MPRDVVHPGEILVEELNATAVSPTDLARQIAVPPNRISQIINGKRSITGDTALRLAHWFGNTPEFWLNLQTAYDIRLARQQAGRSIERLPTRDSASRRARAGK